MAFYKRKAPAQFQDEGFQLAKDGGFQISLVVALVQAQEVKEIRVFENEGGCGVGKLSLSGGVGMQGGKLGALEGFAFDLLAQLAHAPGVGGGLVGVKMAGWLGFER